MAVGGSRVGAGRKPDPNALRRQRPSDQATWLDLPANGHDGPVPAWPFPKGSTRERSIWAKLWRRPQAHAWATLGVWPADVAIFVRLSVAAENGDMKAAGEMRQWNDRLGLNPSAMLQKRWRIGSGPAPKRDDASNAARKSSRSRLKVVPGGGEG